MPGSNDPLSMLGVPGPPRSPAGKVARLRSGIGDQVGGQERMRAAITGARAIKSPAMSIFFIMSSP